MNTPAPPTPATPGSLLEPYDLYMLCMSIVAIALLIVDSLTRASPAVTAVLDIADTAVCVVFMLDFIRSFRRAPDRTRYFVRGGWLDLISSIPTIGVLRLARLTRIARVIRLLRAVRSLRAIGQIVTRHRRQSALLAATMVSGLFLLFASVAVLQFEQSPESNIRTASDAIWWAFATITTVGYGDRYPLSMEGRVVAGMLMVAGVGLFGALSGLVASWFLHGDSQQQEAESIESLRSEVKRLADMLERRGAVPHE